MTKDLTTSDISRQNILNNSYALEKDELLKTAHILKEEVETIQF